MFFAPRRRAQAQRGQVATENIIIVLLVAIALLAFATFYGRKVTRLFVASSKSLDSGTPITDKPIMEGANTPVEIGLGGPTGGGSGTPAGGSSGTAGPGSGTTGGPGGTSGTAGPGSGTVGGPGAASGTTGPGGGPTGTGGTSGTGSGPGSGTAAPGGGSSGTGSGSTGTGGAGPTTPGGATAGTPTGGTSGPGSGTAAPGGAKPEDSKFEMGGSYDKKKEVPFKDADGNAKYTKEGTRVWTKDKGWQDKEKKPEDGSGKVEVAIEYTFHKKDRELKKYETEDDEKYKARTDLAKGRAGVRFGTLDTKVTGNAKWDPKSGEVSVGGSAGVTVTGITAGAEGEVGNDYVKGKGTAEVVVGKVEAKVDAKIGNSKEYAGAKVEAGIGGSVVEGKVTGSVGSKWLGLEVEGELSGALLTAEAKGTAAIGYNKETKKFEVELGGKIGALLAGGGGKIKIKLSKPGWWKW